MNNDGETSSDEAHVIMVHSSLAISPDLNALLEHDERTRGSPHQLDSPLFHSPVSTTTFPVGLPPPPRGNRKPGSRPITPKKSDPGSTGGADVTEPVPGSLSPVPPTSNPFINAPPKLPQLLGSSEREHSHSPLSDSSSPLEMPYSLRKALALVESPLSPEQPRDFFHSSRTPTSPTATVLDNPVDNPPLANQSIPRVEKLIVKGKSIFSGSHASAGSQTVRDEEDGLAGLGFLVGGGKLRSFSGATNQPSSRSNSSQSVVHDQREKNGKIINNDGGDTAISRLAAAASRPSSRPHEESEKSTRPALFHSARSWESFRTRSGSYSSSSTQSPTKALEPRISISSTRFSGYSESLYQSSRPPDLALGYPSGNRNVLPSGSPGHESFIDLFSSSPQLTISDTLSLTGASRPALTSATSQPTSNNQSPSSPHPSEAAASASHTTLHGPKPPVPTAPKPSFKRYSLTQPPDRNQHKTSPSSMHRLHQATLKNAAEESPGPVPPTTNFLNADERADLVKKSRKLAQVFGTTPKAVVISQKHDELPPTVTALSSVLGAGKGKGRHVHGAVSVSRTFKTPLHDDNESKSSWSLPEGTQYMTASGRRHSAPLNPDEFPFLHHHMPSVDSYNGSIEVGSMADSDWSSDHAFGRKGPATPISFIDLSDGDAENDSISADETKKGKRASVHISASTPSLAETLTLGEREEADRKRKRDKLAKLHRYLGSRVPVELVLGLNDGKSSIPTSLQVHEGRVSKLDTVSEHEDHRKAWLTRRRSSSAAVSSGLSHDLERLKEDLNDEEKAIHVRRAQKMEKLFGVPPPQTLYTCHSRPLSSGSSVGPSSGHYIASGTIQTGPPSPVRRDQNSNQSSYKVQKRRDRPDTPESAQQLLPSLLNGTSDFRSRSRDSLTIMDVYTHYQHSLLSLDDIIDRDDRASLVELHQYLRGERSTSPLMEFARTSSSASFKSERRRSLPSSIMSVSTADYGMPLAKPEPTDFQLRRRRAAKLTQFFGVDYKQIIHDILESIEKGVEEERKRGTLQPEEVEALLRKLRTLKTKRSEIL